jgi:hypothetical protein
VKSKVSDLVSSLYKFQTITKPVCIANQQAHVVALMSDFVFTYHVGHDLLCFISDNSPVYQKPVLNGKPKSGLMRSQAIQDGHQSCLVQVHEGQGQEQCHSLEGFIQAVPKAPR